ncbi:MAG TPA: VanZ family protein [Terriglobales bacterium]|nr:VanZ family protein [Terriglobales bacterium]
MTRHQKELLKTWIAAGLWIVLIMIESTSYLSSANTSRFLYPILHYLFGIEDASFQALHHYLRKTGHFVGYFILSFLLFRSWRVTLPLSSRWAMRWAAIAFLMSGLVASMDEWHQTFLPSRTGTIHDVILDSIGALIAQILILLWLRSRNGIQPEGEPVYESSRLTKKLS